MARKPPPRKRQAPPAGARPATPTTGPARGDAPAPSAGGSGPGSVYSIAPAGVREHYSADELDQVVTRRQGWDSAAAEIDAARRQLVATARGRGLSWDGVGWLLGVSGEAARQRFGSGRRRPAK